jgi:predicted Fe-S protein YdhL (DUF1289 family)
MESPCIKVCTIDAASRLCVGCLRSIDEIASWASLGRERRLAVMAELPGRRRARGKGGIA